MVGKCATEEQCDIWVVNMDSGTGRSTYECTLGRKPSELTLAIFNAKILLDDDDEEEDEDDEDELYL